MIDHFSKTDPKSTIVKRTIQSPYCKVQLQLHPNVENTLVLYCYRTTWGLKTNWEDWTLADQLLVEFPDGQDPNWAIVAVNVRKMVSNAITTTISVSRITNRVMKALRSSQDLIEKRV